MSDHPTYDALVIACMDGAYREPDGALSGGAKKELNLKLEGQRVDHIAVPGASVALTLENAEQSLLFKGISLAYHKHGVRKLFIIEHENCGMYAALAERFAEYASPNDRELHAAHSQRAVELLQKHFPGLKIKRFYHKKSLEFNELI